MKRERDFPTPAVEPSKDLPSNPRVLVFKRRQQTSNGDVVGNKGINHRLQHMVVR